MRLKYYKLTLRQMGVKKPFVFFFFLVFVITCVLIYVFNKNIEPTMKILCESNASTVALTCTNNAVYEYIQDIKYDDLVTVQKDEKNKVTALVANVMEMNKISTKVTTKVQEELLKNEESNIILPVGSILGMKTFGGYGPRIKVKTIPSGAVSAKFKSEFVSTGINQTRHSIVLEVSTYIRVLAPFFTDLQTYVNDITVAETVIVGDIPTSYYDIDGNANNTLGIID